MLKPILENYSNNLRKFSFSFEMMQRSLDTIYKQTADMAATTLLVVVSSFGVNFGTHSWSQCEKMLSSFHITNQFESKVTES
jgi:hypothetical protein